MSKRDRIFVALDGLPREQAVELVAKVERHTVGGSVAGYKIHDLWDREGPGVVAALKEAGAREVWVDLKLHDIPKTVGLRVEAVRASGADFVTVHASGGVEMMGAAVDAAGGEVEVFGITVLTSLTEEDTHLLYGNPSKVKALQLARLAKLAGLTNIVCSVHEVSALKRRDLRNIRLIVPGIRLKGREAVDDNQKRVDSPLAAFEAGAYQIVVGSEVTRAGDPVAVLGEIADQAEVVDQVERLTVSRSCGSSEM